MTVRVPILIYHYVEYVADKKDKIRQSLNVPPYILRAQIKTLKGDGYNFITTSDIVDALSGKIKLPPKPIVLTFDDGYMDFYTDVYPILKKENVKAVQYVIVDFLDRPNFMFGFQLQEISKNHLVEIGAHTMDHVWLKGLNKNTVDYQVEQSKITLEKLIGRPVVSFAYPYGAFDRQALEAARQAGFTNAVSTVPGVFHTNDTQYFLYRVKQGYRTGQILLDFLKQNNW